MAFHYTGKKNPHPGCGKTLFILVRGLRTGTRNPTLPRKDLTSGITSPREVCTGLVTLGEPTATEKGFQRRVTFKESNPRRYTKLSTMLPTEPYLTSGGAG